MITTIYTDDGRVLITDKHTKKDLKAVIQEAREDEVEINDEVDEVIDGADKSNRSYILVSPGDMRIEEACRP